MPPIQYLIADDHTLFRQGLRLVLRDDPALEFLGEAADGLELMELMKREKPDVILLDIKMPRMDGIEATKAIRAKYPQVKILILTMHDDEQLILHLLEAGANGYLVKNADAEEIKLALRCCAENGYYFSDKVSAVMLKSVMHKGRLTPVVGGAATLNEREREVLHHLCEGLTAAEIGKQIFLSPRTVEGIKASLMEKTGAKNTAGLVMWAVKHGMETV